MRLVCLLVGWLLLWVGSAAAIEGVNQAEFDAVIEQKCTICHTRERIDEALQRGDKIEEILEKMLRFGVNISERDQRVLGTFWGDPLKK